MVARRVVPGADAVVAAISPRRPGARYLQVGGFSSLRPAPGAPRFVEGDLPAEYRDESLEGEATRVMLVEQAPADLDWVFVSPAGQYGVWFPGGRTDSYRVGGEVALFDEEGGSTVSGADFAAAIVDEIETPAHHRAHIGVVG